MWKDQSARGSEQPELPLSTPPARHAEHPFDWQLDEATCRIGRRGVATARALLARGNDRADDAGSAPGSSEDGAEAA